MNPKILNRDFKLPADDWYEVEVPGEHFNSEANLLQVIDDQAIASIVNRFEMLAADDGFPGLLIDRDHFSLDTSKESKAAGWAMKLRNRAGKLEAQIRWTSSGRADVEGGDYRFFSSVYDQDQVEELGKRTVKNRKKPVRAVRPLQLDRLAITNDPNNKGQRPISNRDSGMKPDGDQPENQPTMKKVNTLLGISDEASEDAAVAEISKIQNRASTAETALASIKKERDALLTHQVEADLDKFEPVITNRDAAKKALIANRSDTLELFQARLDAVGDGTGDKGENKDPITNRKLANPPKKTSEDAEKEAAEKRAAWISNRATSMRSTDKGLSLTQAYGRAESEFDTAK